MRARWKHLLQIGVGLLLGLFAAPLLHAREDAAPPPAAAPPAANPCAPLDPPVVRAKTSAPDAYSACTRDADCEVTSGVCCNSCSGRHQHEERAVNRARKSAYRAEVCRGKSAHCPPLDCDFDVYEGESLPRCIERRCVIARRLVPPACRHGTL